MQRDASSYSTVSEVYYSDLGETTFLNTNRCDIRDESFAKNNLAEAVAATIWNQLFIDTVSE